jgi:hypothetical protein
MGLMAGLKSGILSDIFVFGLKKRVKIRISAHFCALSEQKCAPSEQKARTFEWFLSALFSGAV